MRSLAKVLEFWKPIICKADLFPSMHYLLRLSLALCPGSNDAERLFHLLNRINRQDRRSLNMLMMEQLRQRFCFRHAAGGIFCVRPYVPLLKILRISWRIQKWLKSTKKVM